MLTRLQKISILDTVAFVTGFALMAYELVASRLLAPTIGSSTYIWTSVIGVIIAALSLGFTVGGRLADKRVNIRDISYLLLGSACCMLATIFLASGTLDFISTHITDPRLQGLSASLLLFMPASFLMGMISPYLVRLRTVSVSSTGRSAASLSALNAIGGIIGTFCAGFLFFGYVGASETVGFLGIMLIGVAWFIEPTKEWRLRALITLVAAGLAVNAYAPKTNAAVHEIDTPSAHYQIIEATYKGDQVRLLASGPNAAQSGIYTEGKAGLVFPYTKQIVSIVKEAPRKDKILVLGGGTFTIPDYLGKTHPNSQIDVVEIDPKLLDISKDHFEYKPTNNIHHIFGDARAYLNTAKSTYDIIIVDVYGDASIPFSLTTTEYVQSVKKRLTSDGIVIANIITSPAPECLPLLGSIHRSYGSVFPHSRAFTMRDWNIQQRQNLIVTYGYQPLEWIIPTRPEITQLPPGTQLTDNYAPLERLEQTCSD